MTSILIRATTFLGLLVTSEAFSQSRYQHKGRYYPNESAFDFFGLGFAGKGLLVGFAIMGIGLLLNLLTPKKGNIISGVLIFVGVICCLPAAAMLLEVAATIYAIGAFAIFVIGCGLLLFGKK